jgi:nitrile hydratase beta subunit
VDGIHDLGGMHGFGAICVEPDEPVFHAAWEGRVFALGLLLPAGGLANVDRFRHAVERLSPVTYLDAGYYGRWLRAVETLLVEGGVLRPGELEARTRGTREPSPSDLPPVAPADAAGGALRTVSHAPRFRVGQAVRARNLHPAGHTRLPRYVRGKRGVVAIVHPAWVFPDTNAHGLGEHPQHAYAVRFAGDELWGPDAEPGTAVHVDCFESSLEPE